MEQRWIGFDIGGTKCAVVTGVWDGERMSVTFREQIGTGAPRATVDALCDILQGRLGEGGLAPYLAAGVSCGGPLDAHRGLVLSPPNLPGWDEIPICAWIEKRIGKPTFLCNDANACALAEWQSGAGRGTDNMIFLTFGTGLGAGLILDGRLYHGRRDLAGEVGHVRLEDRGPVGYGKAGSFEGFCSGGGLRALGRRVAMEEGIADPEDLDAKELTKRARAGEPYALETFERCGEKLGKGLAMLFDVLDPDRVVIGSMFVRCEDLLRPPMERVLSAEALGGAECCPRVVPAQLGESLGDIAALCVARDGYLQSRT
ncbi:MAG: ROK family protein [Clostridia bacterium]|nr:ROK family protein [Clostridia bacterium]